MRRLLPILSLPLCLSAQAVLPTLGELHVERYTAEVPLGLSAWQVVRPISKAVNIVVCSEGYTREELYRFPLDAARLRKVLEGVAPYSRHLDKINWYLYVVPSPQSGGGKPESPKINVYGTDYNTGGQRRLMSTDGDAFMRIWTAIKPTFPKWDSFETVVLVNDSEYGGGGGRPLVVSTHDLSGWIFVHELGHFFARLGDEYPAPPYPGFPPTRYANIAISLLDIPWQHWLTNGSPVGVYEGGQYTPVGRWRPMQDACLMHSLTAGRLCPVCEQATEARILNTTK